MAKKDKFLLETMQFWQERTSKHLTEEDAREISENLFNFVRILLDWYHADQEKSHLSSNEKGVS
jgi:sulfur relay (sulfurtransferase) DsrC/TusE family protein